MRLRDYLAPMRSPVIAQAEAVELVPVGTAATSETVARELDPVAAMAFGIGDGTGTVTRRYAMRVPAIRRGRNLIAGTIATLSLIAVRAGRPVPRPLLSRLDPNTSPAYVIAWTVDDLLFYGVAWWRVTARDDQGFPSAVERIRRDRVTILLPTDRTMGRVLIDNSEVADRDLIRFDGLDEGLLVDAADTIRAAHALMRGARRVADDDWSGQVLKLAEGAPELSNLPGSAGIPDSDLSEVEALQVALDTSRLNRSTPYLNRAVDLVNVGLNARDRQLSELVGVVRTELALALNLPASRVSAPDGGGLTYTNVEGDRRDLADTTLAPFLAAIAQRLSLDDVTPHGQSVTFDLTAYLRGSTTDLVSAGVAAIGAGIADEDEVRTHWLGLPPRPERNPA